MKKKNFERKWGQKFSEQKTSIKPKKCTFILVEPINERKPG